jgi:hypothetical protein
MDKSAITTSELLTRIITLSHEGLNSPLIKFASFAVCIRQPIGYKTRLIVGIEIISFTL